MTEYEQMRIELAKQFRETVPVGRQGPLLDKDGKDMAHGMYGKTQTKYQKECASKSATGNTWRRGSKQTAEARQKMSDSTDHSGDNNPRWKGGISLGEKRKEYMDNWYKKNKHHYQAGGKYSDRKAA